MPLGSASRFFLWALALAHVAGAAAYSLVQPRGFRLVSLAFFEHQVLGPLVLVTAFVLALSLVRRRHTTALALASAFAGFWIVIAGVGFFLGTTSYALALLFPLLGAASAIVFACVRLRRLMFVLVSALPGALVGAAVWVSVIAPPASTHPSNHPTGELTVPNSPPELRSEQLRVAVEGAAILVEAGSRRAWIVPSFDYTAVADSCSLTVLDYRAVGFSSYRAGADAQRIVFAAENRDLQTSGKVSLEGPKSIRIDVSTTVKHELCAHLGAILTVSLVQHVGSGVWMGAQNATVNGFPWPAGGAFEPYQFVAFQGDKLGFFRATEDEKGPFEFLQAIDEPEIAGSGFRIRVPSWKEQASREPSPTAGWGISQGAIEHVGNSFFWEIAATSIGRGWHTVRTAPGTYEVTMFLETR